MAAKKVTTVKGKDIEAGQVVKIGGRWYRVVGIEPDDTPNFLFVRTVKHDHDPRLVAAHLREGKLRLVWKDEDVLTREQEAPVWDWVTRELERRAPEDQRNTETCATVGCRARATETITYDYRGQGETTTDKVCTPCADGYSRRPVLKNFTRTPTSR